MKKILFPTDFSKVAENAFIHALEFAKNVNGELILLHTFELPVIDNQYYPMNYTEIIESIELANFEVFKDEIPKLRAIAMERKLGGIKMTHRLMDGDLVSNIKNAIKEEKIDFVIMGTSGTTGWAEFFIGSNTGSVIAAVDVPVLSIPVDSKFRKIENIAFTTRFRDKDKEALKSVLKIAKKTNATVNCLYVKTYNSDVSSKTIKEWEKEFEKDPVHFSVVLSDSVKESILDFISHKSIDVLAILTYKRNFFVELFNPSLTQNLSNHVNIPVLAMHFVESKVKATSK